MALQLHRQVFVTVLLRAWVCGVAVVALLTSGGVAASIVLGWSWQVVLSGSMEPAVRSGSLLLVRPTSGHLVEPGDVVTFREAGRRTTHRVVDVSGAGEGRRLTTQGDANLRADPVALAPAEVEGEVAAVLPLLGTLVREVDRPLVGPGLVLAGAATALVPALRERRRTHLSAPSAGRPSAAVAQVQ